MRGFERALPLAALAAASLVFVLGGCAAPETVQRDIHVKRGVTLEDDLIHFYGAPSQRIIRGESEYFVYNGRTMNITSADGASCHGTPVFIFSYDTKRLSDLKCRENIPAEELSSKAGDSIVVGVTDSGSAPMYDASSQDASGADIGLGAELAPASGVEGANEAAVAGPQGGDNVPVEDLGESTDGINSVPADSGSGAGAGDSASSESSGDEIPLAGENGEMEIINR